MSAMGSNGQLAVGAAACGSSDFVRKLYKMLECPSDENIVRWGNEGDSFVVLENEVFTKRILPKHFKHSNFASFVRQLNKYDFHKVRHSNEEGAQSPYGPAAWEFKHPDFRINNKDALDNIRRKAPAARKPTTQSGDDSSLPSQVEQLHSDLASAKSQLRHTQEQYTELSVQHSMMLMDMVGLQKTVQNHDQVIRNLIQSVQFLLQQAGHPFPNIDLALLAQPTPQPLQSQAGHQRTQHQAGSSSSSTINGHEMPSEQGVLSEQSESLKNAQARAAIGPLNSHMIDTKPSVFPMSMQTENGAAAAAAAAAAAGGGPAGVALEDVPIGGVDQIGFPVSQAGEMPLYGGAVGFRQPSQAELARKTGSMECSWVREPHVLLVEDDPTCKRIGHKFLLNFSCKVKLADDGLEALNAINSESFDLVLMDIIMPNLDGVSTCGVIRNFHNTPIVAMTSNVKSEDINHYFKAGMNDVLPKPFTKEGLFNMLEKHLAHLKAAGPAGGNGGGAGQPSDRPSAADLASAGGVGHAMGPAKEDPAHSNHTSAWNSPIPIAVMPGVIGPHDGFVGGGGALGQHHQQQHQPQHQQQQHQPQHPQHQQHQQHQQHAHAHGAPPTHLSQQHFGQMNPSFQPSMDMPVSQTLGTGPAPPFRIQMTRLS